MPLAATTNLPQTPTSFEAPLHKELFSKLPPKIMAGFSGFNSKLPQFPTPNVRGPGNEQPNPNKNPALFINLPGGGGGDCCTEIVSLNPIPDAFGALPAGYIPNKTVLEVVRDLLNFYTAPTFSNFDITNILNAYELGEVVPSGLFDFIWATTTPGNIQANSLTIRDVDLAFNLATGLANDGNQSISYGPLTFTVPTTKTFQIQALNTLGSPFTRNTVIRWVPRRWRGIIPNTSRSALEAITDVTDLLAVPSINILDNSIPAPGAKYTGPQTLDLSSYPSPGGLGFWLYDDSLGTTTFTQGAFAYPTTTVVIPFTNTQGVTRNYRLYITATASVGSAININLA